MANLLSSLPLQLGVAAALGFAGFYGFANPQGFNELVSAVEAGQQIISSDCTIKGNISSSGERIFHIPGQRYYSATRIDAMAGERWFCSPAEALDAGWRPSRV